MASLSPQHFAIEAVLNLLRPQLFEVARIEQEIQAKAYDAQGYSRKFADRDVTLFHLPKCSLRNGQIIWVVRSEQGQIVPGFYYQLLGDVRGPALLDPRELSNENAERIWLAMPDFLQLLADTFPSVAVKFAVGC